MINRIFFSLLAVFGALNAGAQTLDTFPRTTTFTNTDLLLVQTNSAGSAGQKFSRSITASNFLENLKSFPNWSAGSATRTNGTVISTASTSLDFIEGTNVVIRATNAAGVVTVQINASGGGSVDPTNAVLANIIGTGAATNVSAGLSISAGVISMNAGISNIAITGVSEFATNRTLVPSIFTNTVYVNARGANQAANGLLLTNAMSTSPAFCRIVVGPGDYFVSELAVPSPAFSVDNRWIEFQPGANWRVGSPTSAAANLFDDSAGKVTNVWVTGRGNFFSTNTPGGSGTVLYLENASTVYFEHQNLYLTNADSSFSMGGIGNNTITWLTHGRASTWTYDNAYFNASTTNRLYAFQNEVETVGDILETGGDAREWGDVVFGYNRAWGREGTAGQASLMQIGGRVIVKNGALVNERTNASIFSTSATTNGLIEGGMILMPPNGRRSVLEDNSQGTGVPFNGMTALWMKNIYLRGATNVDAFSLTNGTVNETILENVRVEPGWASTNVIRATTPSKVRIVGNLEIHPYKPFGTGITLVGSNTVSSIRNVGTFVTHGAAYFSNLVYAIGNITSGGTLAGADITSAGSIDGVDITASGQLGTAALNIGNPTPSSILRVNSNGDVTNAAIGTGLSFDGTTLSATASSGTNNPILFSGGTLTLIANQTSRHKHSTNASFAFALSGASNQSAKVFAEFQNTSTNTIYATNATGFYDVDLSSNVTVIPIAGSSVLLMDAYLSVSKNWVADLRGAQYALEFSNGTKATNHTTKTVTYTAPSGGSSSFNETNITVSTTNEIVIDVSAFDVVKVKLLTNLNTLTISNVSTMGKRAQVYFQQDTNGTRTIANNRVAGGLLQTNANLQPTTNANALDMLEIMPGLFSSNAIAWWPQNFQPRVAFTNSLSSPALVCSGAILSGDTERFESGAGAFCLTGWTETDSASKLDSYSSVQFVTGTRSMRVDLDNAANAFIYANPADDDFSVRFYLRTTNFVAAIGAGNTVELFRIDSETSFAGVPFVGLDLRVTGAPSLTIRIRNTTTDTTGPTLSENTWYRIELDCSRNATSTLRVFDIGGAQVGTDVSLTAPDLAFTYMMFGKANSSTGASTYWMDNITYSAAGTFPIGADE